MKIKIKDYDYGPIGRRIKEVRLERKFTQEYVAEKLDVSCQHISDIERGLNGMSVPSLMELCKVLDIDADYILFGTVTRSKNNPINNAGQAKLLAIEQNGKIEFLKAINP